MLSATYNKNQKYSKGQQFVQDYFPKKNQHIVHAATKKKYVIWHELELINNRNIESKLDIYESKDRMMTWFWQFYGTLSMINQILNGGGGGGGVCT